MKNTEKKNESTIFRSDFVRKVYKNVTFCLYSNIFEKFL